VAGIHQSVHADQLADLHMVAQLHLDLLVVKLNHFENRQWLPICMIDQHVHLVDLQLDREHSHHVECHFLDEVTVDQNDSQVNTLMCHDLSTAQQQL
jgi:hypothetical protein